MDNEILKLWPRLRIPSFHHIVNEVKVNRKEVMWHTLTFPLVKLNFYGASRGNLGLSRDRICFRNFQGKLIHANAIPSG